MVEGRSSQQQQNVVRHGGKAHIRGKIRRVWRPRYLELCDDGRLLYYQDDDNERILKFELRVHHARILDGTTFRDLHVGLPRGTFGFLLSGQKLDTTSAPRDFLCAVSTLEDAQMWVVALQWAAASTCSMGLATTAALSFDMAPAEEAPRTFPRRSLPQNKLGKIVVTRVRRYKWVWNPHLLQYPRQVAYEIQLLLLKTTDTTTFVEERSVWRTRNDLHQLVNQLLPTSHRWLKSLQRIDSASSLKQLEATLSLVEEILKELALEAKVVNSRPLKDFLGLNKASNKKNKKSISPETNSADVHVKQWLAWSPPPRNDWTLTMEFAISQRWNPTTLAYLAALWMLLPPFWRFYYRHVPSITIRVDVGILILVATILATRQYDRNYTSTTATQTSTSTDSSETDWVSTASSSVGDEDEEEEEGDRSMMTPTTVLPIEESPARLSSPLPLYPANEGESCWSKPSDDIFYVRGPTYLKDRIKIPSDPAPFPCRGVDVWLTDNPERHIARHPAVLNGTLLERPTFLVNFLLPFGNFCAYFEIPPEQDLPERIRRVWTGFCRGDQQYRDARLKLLPKVMEGPWIVKAAVGPGTHPALLGKAIPLQYFFSEKVCEVDVIITASSIAKGILSVVKGHTHVLSMAFAFIIEASNDDDLPETVLCSFQIHALHLEDCPVLPKCNLDAMSDAD